MKILVSDNSVLVNLERGGLFEAALSCEFIMLVPDLLYKQELESYNGQYLRALGLGVAELTAKELMLAQTIKGQMKGLSLSDCFALVCSFRSDHSLVSENKILCGEATKHCGVAYGLLWILDRMEESGIVQKQLLLDGLTAICNYPWCHLPKDEIKTRLSKWST